MAESLKTFVSTGATVPVGTNIMGDDVTVGGSTGWVEAIKIADGTAGSTTLVPMSSAAIGGPGLQTFVVNSTANPIGVSIAAGQSTVTGSGAFHVDDNAASLTVDFNNAAISTANPIPMRLVSSAGSGDVIISSAAPNSSDAGLFVRQVGFVAYSTNVTVAALSSASIVKIDTVAGTVTVTGTVTANIAGNSTAILSTASKIQVELSTTLAGGSSGNALWVQTIPQLGAGNSTFANLKITSTALGTLFSSAASTRFNLTDLQIVNDFGGGGAATVVTVYDGSTSGTKLFQSGISSAGGGINATFTTPRSGSSGNGIVVECVPSSTVYISAGAFKSA